MFGILNINKPRTWTSRDAVNRVHRLVRPAKAGHAGTLDPLATGVLVVCIGPATRLIEYVQQARKEYAATFLLGHTSASDDVETETTEIRDAPIPKLAEIENAIPSFIGRIEQLPPIYSAVKIDGQRAYALARQGKEFEMRSRQVDVLRLEILSYEYPRLELAIECGGGTYVRSLGRDLARKLGTDAVMSDLIRTRIGNFHLADSLTLGDLCAETLPVHLKSPGLAVQHLRSIQLTAPQVLELRFGRAIECDMSGECAGFDEQGNLVAILQEKSPGLFKPHINFAPSL